MAESSQRVLAFDEDDSLGDNPEDLSNTSKSAIKKKKDPLSK